MSDVNRTIKAFLEAHRRSDRPLLVGVSGGADSLALLKALQNEAPLHIAHVDHGWREGSEREARALEAHVRDLGLPFHCMRGSGKTEDEARSERLAFFSALAQENDCEALVLAHHMDDLAETVFKRVVEGASLAKLGGIRPVHQIGDLLIWRPLLPLSKEMLAAYIDEPLVRDETNTDPSYHRGLLRSRIFPHLEKELNRPLAPNLARLGAAASELESYLDHQAARFPVRRNALGLWIDFTNNPHPIEIRHLLRQLFTLSRESLDLISQFIIGGVANRMVQNLYIDRGHLFQFSNEPVEWSADWTDCEPTDWRGLWGEGFVLSRWFREEKMPAALRSRIPFLTGSACDVQKPDCKLRLGIRTK